MGQPASCYLTVPSLVLHIAPLALLVRSSVMFLNVFLFNVKQISQMNKHIWILQVTTCFSKNCNLILHKANSRADTVFVADSIFVRTNCSLHSIIWLQHNFVTFLEFSLL